METQTLMEIVEKYEYKLEEHDEGGFLGINYTEACNMINEHTTTQIEVLRERLKEKFASVVIHELIDETFNQFLKELSDGK
jgi:hypothetical protein